MVNSTDIRIMGEGLSRRMDRVVNEVEWEKHMSRLRQSLERAVQETGSLTDARVLRISSRLDRAVVAQLRGWESEK